MSRVITLTSPSGATLKTKEKYVDDDIAIQVSGGENVVAGNIKSGVTILGVSGTYEGFIPSGSITISENGTYNISAFAEAMVSVPGLVPSGTLEISGNGVYDVGTYASANVNVSTLDTAAEILEGKCSVLNNSCSIITSNFFHNYPNLTEVNLPNCTSVGNYCFGNCSNLLTVNAPNLSHIGYSAFALCPKISVFSTNASSVTFNYGAFSDCSSLTAVYTPNASYVVLSNYAFAYCGNLESMACLSTGALAGMDSYALNGCKKISYPLILNCRLSSCSVQMNANNFPYIEINIQNSSVQAVYISIYDNSALSSIRIDMSGAHSYYRTVYIYGMQSTGIQKIDDSCFIATSGKQPNVAWNYNRIFMNTPISLFSISKVAVYSFTSSMFYGCSNLKNVFIGDNTTTQLGIHNGAFCNCTALETYIVSGNAGGTYSNSVFMNCYNLSYFYTYRGTFGNGQCTFENCYNLKSIMCFFGFVTNGFKNCSSLESIYLLQDFRSWNYAHPFGTLNNSNCFDGTPIADSSILGHFGSIYVPASQYSSYITATNWVLFSDRFVSLTEEEENAAKKAYKDGGGLSSIWSY